MGAFDNKLQKASDESHKIIYLLEIQFLRKQ